MQKIKVKIFSVTLLIIASFMIMPSYASSTSSITVSLAGSISDLAPSPFSSKGTVVDLNTLYPGNTKYQPNGWAILQDLGVNLIDVRGGGEGDYHVQWNINNYPNQWATNFNNFLTLANSHGIRVMFSYLGDDSNLLFGIQCPEPYRGIAGTPIATAKSMIDKLAGNNNLNHNFLADPRVFAWSPANEVYLDNAVTRDWVLQMLDYMRSKGALVDVSCPINNAYSSNWLETISFQATEPTLRGHIDFLNFHIYEVQVAMTAQQNGQDVYTVMYTELKANLEQYMINGRGSMSTENLMLGEFGLWQGYGSSMSVTGTFTEQTRGAYYRAIYQACMDLGIKHVINYYCFADNNPTYEIVGANGSYYNECTSVMKQYYK